MRFSLGKGRSWQSRSLVAVWVASLVFSSFACLHGSEAQAVDPGAKDKGPKAQSVSDTISLQASRGPVADAQRLGDAVSVVAEQVSPAVVSMRVETKQKTPDNPFQFFFGPFGQQGQQPDERVVRGSGSGVVIRPDGYILTNNHVVDNATRIEVMFHDKRSFVGKVVGTDPATDLAVVKIDAKGLPYASFADTNKARVGQWVVAIGSPFGLDYTVTAGVLSAVGRGGIGANEIEDYLQTDASINPGNSGGPLVNLKGEVLGINTMIVGRGTGIGFAVPASLARNVSDQIISHGTVKRAWIGVGFQELTPELASQFGVSKADGALVSNVEPGGPASKSGVKTGDIIVSVDGAPVTEGRDLLRNVLRKKVGSKIALGVVRNKKTLKLYLVTGERPNEQGAAVGVKASPSGAAAPGFGLQVQPLSPRLAEQLGVAVKNGLVVTEVESGSPAERAGLRKGDVISEADHKLTSTLAHLNQALSDGKALLRVLRKDRSFFAVLLKDTN
ncbi:MAG: Do family serine endopeptidase [Myxococcales bacterium]|nr:MAG: Do family serine endopeptidase [Myxococcales bacterium]